MQVRPIETDSFSAAVDQKRVSHTFSLKARAPFEQIHERGKLRTDTESRIGASYG